MQSSKVEADISQVRAVRFAKSRKWVLAVAAVCASAVAVAGCGGGEHADWPRLRLEGKLNPGVSDEVAGIRPGHPASLGSILVCLTRPGRVTITRVKPYRPEGDIVVQAYAVRRHDFRGTGIFLGDSGRPLSRLPGFGHDHVVDVQCGTQSHLAAYELGLQLTHPTRADVAAHGWIVYYRSRGHTGTVDVPFAVAVCSEPSANAPACRTLLP